MWTGRMPRPKIWAGRKTRVHQTAGKTPAIFLPKSISYYRTRESGIYAMVKKMLTIDVLQLTMDNIERELYR